MKVSEYIDMVRNKVSEYIDTVRNDEEVDITKISYLSYQNKINLCNEVFNEAMFINKRFKSNLPYLNIVYLMKIIEVYTILEIDDVWRDYDGLAANGLIDVMLSSQIPQEELKQLDEILGWIAEDYETNKGGKQ